MKKIFFLRTEIDRLLTSSILFSCMLVVVRIAHTGVLTFIFMIWNLFLAYIPYALTTWLTARYTQPGTRGRGAQLLFVLLSLAWLLFIPNTFYILTDLYHLADNYRHHNVPQWYDLVLILSCAWNGLLMGVLSVRQMERLLLPNAGPFAGWLFIYPVMVLNALGVYLGRYPRYNSWDIISDPFELLKDIARMIVHPFHNQYAWGMILSFSILLTLMYRMMRGGSKALA